MKKIIILLFLLIPSLCFGATEQVLLKGQTTINSTNNLFYTMSGSTGANATENQRQTVVSSAGKLHSLGVLLGTAPGAGTSYTFTTSINGVAGTLTCTISGTDTSCLDSTNADTVIAGDLVSIKKTVSGATASGTINLILKFTPTTSGETIFTSSSESTNLGASTIYIMPLNSAAATATEAQAEIVMPTSGTFKNLYFDSTAAAGAGKSYTITVRRTNNTAADTAITCNISGASQKTCNDTSNTHTVVAGDKYVIKSVFSGTPAPLAKGHFGLTFVPDIEGEFVLGLSGNANALNTAADAFAPINGNAAWDTTGANVVQVTHRIIVKSLYVDISAAPGDGKSWTFVLRDDGVSVNNTCSISGASDTTCNITSALDDIAFNSLVSFKASPSSTPAAATAVISVDAFLTPRRIW